MSNPKNVPIGDSGGASPPTGNYALLLLAIPLTVVVVLFGMGLLGQKEPIRVGSRDYPTVGDKLPVLRADEWLNGNPPRPEELAGNVVVLDVWASWCFYCGKNAPELVELHEKYKDQGVVFLGLSTETAEALPEMEAFIKKCKFTWPNGYGADHTLEQLAVEGIPRIWVVGKDGRIVWESYMNGTIEEAIQTALAQPGEST